MQTEMKTPENEKKQSKARPFVVRRLIAFLVTAGSCGTLIWLVLFSDGNTEALPTKADEAALRPVSVIVVEPASYQTSIEAYGEVTPEWNVRIKSKVQGEVLQVSKAFKKGNSIKKGQVLLSVEPTEYQVQLREMQLALEDAKTKLLVEEKEGKDAEASWRRSGLKDLPTSPLLLREPYLNTARANLALAREQVERAEQQLGYTSIKAPFDGIVVQRNVSPGGTLFSGDEVGTLYGIDTFVITLNINEHEWQKLPERWQETTVKLYGETPSHSWSGTLVREGNVFDSDSRLRSLFVEVNHPLQLSPPLLPGAFVRAEVPGRSIPGLLRVPDSARTQKGQVWYVDKENRLQSVQVNPVFREKGYLYYRYPGAGSTKIVINPNNSFVNGLQVTPVIREGK